MSQLVVQFFKSNFSQKDSQTDPNSSIDNSPAVNSKDVNVSLVNVISITDWISVLLSVWLAGDNPVIR